MRKIVFIGLAVIGLPYLLYNFWIRYPTEKIDLQNLASHCKITNTCGNLIAVDCGAAVDGPLYYVNKKTEMIVEYCGGSCMGSHGKPSGKYCRNCPPKEWNCSD